MPSWFHLPTLLIALALACLVAFIVRGLMRDKKKGKHICGGSCGSCPNACSCHHNG